MPKNWLVTGSARGLGRAIVAAVLARGDGVVATARNPDRLDNLKEQFPETLEVFALDVADAPRAQAAVDFALGRFGRLDVLVNNAGYGRIAPFEVVDEREFRDQIETNFFGVVNLARAAMPTMRAQRSGLIVNVSSIGGRIFTPGFSAYQAAKWAVSGFSEVLAAEARDFGVRVVALEPGGIRTDWIASSHEETPEFPDEYAASVGDSVVRHREYAGHEPGDPDRIAQIVFDLSRSDLVPVHLVMGSDALRRLEAADATRKAEQEAWRDVTNSVDFDAAAAVVPPAPEMSDLERLVATEALRDLQSRYVRLADAGDWQGLAGLFAPGGVFVALNPDGSPQAEMRGHAEIIRTIAAGVGMGRATHHLFSYEIKILSPTRATGVWTMEDWIDRGDEQLPPDAPFRRMHGGGRYHVEYERHGSGWLIARQTLRRTFLETTH